MFKKRSVYLMHGYTKLEDKNDEKTNKKRNALEDFIIKNADDVVCVSRLLERVIKKEYPGVKTSYIYNIVNPPLIKQAKKKKNQIMVTGGGMPQKNNLLVCEAIETINSTRKAPETLHLVIAGKPYGREQEFKKRNYVSYLGDIPHEECLKRISESQIYIQNSTFETFGIAVLEAALCGCNLLLSKNIGAREVINGLGEQNTINNVDDLSELIEKIRQITTGAKSGQLEVDLGAINGMSVSEKLLAVMKAKK